MTEAKTLLIGSFLYGYVPGEERVCIKNEAEQIAAFIMKHRFESVKIVNFLDVLEVQTMAGFIDICTNQDFLNNQLLPALLPMQTGETDVVEFIPFIDENYIIRNVRLEKRDGNHHLADINYFNGVVVTPTSEDFGSANALLAAYPNTIDGKEAEYIMNCSRYTREEFILAYVETLADQVNGKELLNVSEECFDILFSIDKEQEFRAEVAAAVNKLSNEELNQFTKKHDMYILVTD